MWIVANTRNLVFDKNHVFCRIVICMSQNAEFGCKLLLGMGWVIDNHSYPENSGILDGCWLSSVVQQNILRSSQSVFLTGPPSVIYSI